MLSNTVVDFGEERELEVLSEMAIKTKEIDWKPAIILSAAYLEKVGILRIAEILKNRKTKLGKKLDNLSLNEVSLFLYALHQISDKEHTQINQIQKERNRIVHPRGAKIPIYFGEKADNKYKKLIENALEIISSLKTS
jgi:hypothetical protein